MNCSDHRQWNCHSNRNTICKSGISVVVIDLRKGSRSSSNDMSNASGDVADDGDAEDMSATTDTTTATTTAAAAAISFINN